MAPFLNMRGRYNDQVDRDAEIAEGEAKPHKLRSTALQLRLDDEQIQVAVRATLAASAGAEQDHLGVRRGCCQTAGSLCDEGVISQRRSRAKRSRPSRRLASLDMNNRLHPESARVAYWNRTGVNGSAGRYICRFPRFIERFCPSVGQ